MANDTIPRVVVPLDHRRPGVKSLLSALDVTLVIGPEQTALYSQEGIICGTITTKSLLFGIGVSKDKGKIVCHSQYDVAI